MWNLTLKRFSRTLYCTHQFSNLGAHSKTLVFSEHLIKNSGSIARDILATERTFLAWARTGLGFVGAGSALFAAYHRKDTAVPRDVMPACVLLLANGSFLLAFATRRYLKVIHAISTQNQFPVAVGNTLFAVFVTAMGTVGSLGLLARAEMQSAKK